MSQGKEKQGQEGEKENRSFVALLEDLDMERNNAHIEVFKLQALLELCISSEYVQHQKKDTDGEDPLDWFSLFKIMRGIVAETDDKLDRIDGLHFSLLRKVEGQTTRRGIQEASKTELN